MSIGESMAFFDSLSLTGQRAQIADKILKEIRDRLSFLINVGLNYLSLERSADTLSGGEAQRIRLQAKLVQALLVLCTYWMNHQLVCTNAITTAY